MPVAPPADARPTAPGTRRRVWAAPELRSHGLLVLTADRMVLAAVPGPPRPEVKAAAEAGADLDDLLGPFATTVDYARVRRAKLDLVQNAVSVRYDGPAGPAKVTVLFAGPEAADACFTKLWRRLGGAFALRPYRRDTLAVAAAPLAALGAVLLVTAVLALAVHTFDAFAHDRPGGVVSVPAAGALGSPGDGDESLLERLIGWMDWRAICAAGGAAAAGTQVWLYRRLTTPPNDLEVIRG